VTTRKQQLSSTSSQLQLSRHRPLLACLIVFFVAAALYLPAVGHEFVWDDLSILMANPALGDWSQLGSNLTSGFFQETSSTQAFDYWRPLVVLSHMVDRTLWGDAPWGPHLVNLLLHATVSLLVLLLAQSWLRNLPAATAAALFFATHPVQVEVVAWVSGRSDLLFGLFFAMALLADRLYGLNRRTPWLAVSLTSFAAALLSKEVAVVFPALVAIRSLLSDGPTKRGGNWRHVLAAPVPSLVTLALYLWIRFGLVAVDLPATVASPAHRVTTFWTWWSAFLRYMELLVVPWKLTILHQLELADAWWSPRALVGLLVFTALVLAAWRLRSSPGATFGIAILLVCLAPFSNVLLQVSAQGGAAFPLAERFLYVPSIGFFIFAAWILAVWLPVKLPLKSRRVTESARSRWSALGGQISMRLVPALIPILILLAAGTRTHVRIQDWSSDLNLFSSAVRSSPGSYLAHLNYASALSSTAGSDAELMTARTHYLEALELAPTNHRVHYNLANLSMTLGRSNEAETFYRQALALQPRLPQARLNLGTLLARRGDLEEALAQFEAAQTLLPGAVAPKVNRAHVLQALGRPAEAIPLYREALALRPELPAAVQGLARATESLRTAREDPANSP
jgi:hypothetical protein